jgi:hypothetical protein
MRKILGNFFQHFSIFLKTRKNLEKGLSPYKPLLIPFCTMRGYGGAGRGEGNKTIDI